MQAPRSSILLPGLLPSPQLAIRQIGQIQQDAGHQSTARIQKFPQTSARNFGRLRRVVLQLGDKIPQNLLHPLERWLAPLAFRLLCCDQLLPAPECMQQQAKWESTRGLNEIKDGLCCRKNRLYG